MTWPFIYELPRFAPHLLAELNSAKSTLSLSASSYHSVVRALFDDIMKYTMLVVYSGLSLSGLS